MTRTFAWQGILGALGAAVIFAPLAASGQSLEVRAPVVVDQPADNFFVLVDEESAKSSERKPQVRLTLAAEKPSEYWLGIALGELPEVAQQQLGLDGGLVVADVMDDSPAAKAEFKKHDILIKADDKPLKSPPDLLKVVDGSQGKEVAIVLIRSGKDRTITVVPVKRADAAKAQSEKERVELVVPQAEFRDEIRNLEDVLNKLKSKAGDGALSLWFPKPAVVAPRVEYKLASPTKVRKVEFPKNLSVQINKQGGEPTKIHVKQGEKEWSITEDERGISLSELPEDIRAHVNGLLHGSPASGMPGWAQTKMLRVAPSGKIEGEIKIVPVPPAAPAAPQPPVAGAPPAPPAPPQIARLNAYRVESGGVEAKLDAIMKKLDQLSKEVDELQNRSSSDKK